MKRVLLPLFFLVITLASSVHAQGTTVSAGLPRLEALNLTPVGGVKATIPVIPVPTSAYGSGWFTEDQNADGLIDFAWAKDRQGLKTFEAYDTNFDGKMDDFYVYQTGILSRREIDSNFDENIDLWVYLHRGAYVRAYERDRTYDGIIDTVKQY